MFSLSLLFTLFGLVLSVERPSTNATSLLGMIRNDPKALVTIFDTADKTKIDTIIKLLGDLIVEANREIGNINRAQVECNQKAKEAQDVWTIAIAKEKQALSTYTAAQRGTARAEGLLAEAQKINDAESPRLQKEIEIFQKVINILKQILANDKKNGVNLSEEDSNEVSAFISLADQADPVKVQKILALLAKLLATSSGELKRIETAVKEATDYLEECQLLEKKALGQYVAAQAATRDAQRDFYRILGGCVAAKKEGDARKNVLGGELKTLQNVIALLKAVNA